MKTRFDKDAAPAKTRLEQIMTTPPQTCHASDSLETALRRMWDHDCGFVPIVSEVALELEGVVTDRDASIALWSRGEPAANISLQSVLQRNVVCAGPEDRVARAHELMREHQVRRLPIIGDRQQVLGIVSVNDLARHAARLTGPDHAIAMQEVGETIAAVCRDTESHEAEAPVERHVVLA